MLINPENVGRTTVQLKRTTLDKLNKYKITEEQSYDEVINLLMAGKSKELLELRQALKKMTSAPEILGATSNLSSISERPWQAFMT